MVSVKNSFYQVEEKIREKLGVYEGEREREKQEWEPDLEALQGAVEPAWEEKERYKRYNERRPNPGERLIYERKNGEFIGIWWDEGHRIYNHHFYKKVYRRGLKGWKIGEGKPLFKPADEDFGELIEN